MESILPPGPVVVAFDVGGTDIKAAIIDETGSFRRTVRTPTPPSADGTATVALERIAELWTELTLSQPDLTPRAAGLLVPGLVVEETGMCVVAENLGWVDAPVWEQAQLRLPVPLAFGHDVRGAGEAEQRLGVAAGYRNCAVVIIGTGIAGALFVGGEPYSADGYAGEIGHMVVEPGGRACVCGNRGCLEAIASAAAIVRRYRERTGHAVDGAREVLARATAGDSVAQEIWATSMDAIALALSHLVAVFAPEAIVLGGGLAQAGSALFDPLEERLGELIVSQRRPQLLPARIGENAGLVGAALRARDLL